MNVIDFTAREKTLGNLTFTADEAKLLKWIMTAFKPKKDQYLKYCPRGMSEKETETLAGLAKQPITFTYPQGKTVVFPCINSFIYDAPGKMIKITLNPVFVELLQNSKIRL